MSNEFESGSVTNKATGMTVEASPFNPVKLDLVLIIILAVPVFFIQDRMIDSAYGQIGLLLTFGLGALLWVVVRVRKILRKIHMDAAQVESK